MQALAQLLQFVADLLETDRLGRRSRGVHRLHLDFGEIFEIADFRQRLLPRILWLGRSRPGQFGFHVGKVDRFEFGLVDGMHLVIVGIVDHQVFRGFRLQASPVPVLQQQFELGFGEFEHRVGVAALLAQGLEVVFEADHHLGKLVEAVGVHEIDHIVTVEVVDQSLDRGHGAILVEQGQRSAGLGQQRTAETEILFLGGVLDEIEDRVLDLLDVVEGGGNHARQHVVHLEVEAAVGAFLFLHGIGTLLQHLQRLLDLQQLAGHVQQPFLLRLLATLDDGLDAVDLGLDHLALGSQTDHREGIGDDMQLARQLGQLGGVAHVAVDIDLEAALDLFQVAADGLGHGLHQLLVGAGNRALGGIAGQELFQPVGGLDGLALGAVALRLGDVVEQVLDQVDGLAGQQLALAVKDHLAQQLIDLAEQHLHRDPEGQVVAGNGFDQGADDPPQPRHLFRMGAFLEHLADPGQPREIADHLVFPDHAEQAELVGRTQLLRQRARGQILRLLDLLGIAILVVHGQVGQEQQLFGEQILVARGADIVEQGQDRDRDILLPGLDVF